MNDSKQTPIAMHAVIVYARSCKKEQSQVNNERNTYIYIGNFSQRQISSYKVILHLIKFEVTIYRSVIFCVDYCRVYHSNRPPWYSIDILLRVVIDIFNQP